MGIQDDVGIGIRVTILGNVDSIGIGEMIGSGAVETKVVPDDAIVAVNPVRMIRYRIRDIKGV